MDQKDWDDLDPQLVKSCIEYLTMLFLSFAPVSGHSDEQFQQMLGLALAGLEVVSNENSSRDMEINSERHRDSTCTDTQPSPGTSDAAPGISHSSDGVEIRSSSTSNPVERENMNYVNKVLTTYRQQYMAPSGSDNEEKINNLFDSFWNVFDKQYDARVPGCSTTQSSAEQSDTSKPGCSKWPTSAEQSDTSEPGCSNWPTSAEQPDTSEPGWSKWTTSAEQSGTSKPGCSTRQTSAEREIFNSWNFFRQELNSAGPSARVDDRSESPFCPLGDERLIDSLKNASRSQPSSPLREPEARECEREISSERWGGHIQRVESADDGSQSSSLRPDYGPLPEVSLSSDLRMNSNDFVAPEQRAESFEQNRIKLREKSRKGPGIWDEALGELAETWGKLQQEKKRHAMLTRQRKKEEMAARLAAFLSGPSGLRRSLRLMAQKRKTQIPKELEEGSNPKTRRERDNDSDISD